MITAWVIGSHGLLGSALCRALASAGTHVFDPGQRFHWEDPVALRGQLAMAVGQFAAQANTAMSWEIYWAAGVGTMRSTPPELMPETLALDELLHRLDTSTDLSARPGAFALASSAGALYAGSTDPVISERSALAPTTAYAQAKLAQESSLQAFAATHPGMAGLITRLSTLYGPGQTVAKQQGLLAHIAHCIVLNSPIHIYVPLDTIRDYIAAEDAASDTVRAMRRPGRQGGLVTAQIVASQQPTTISEILARFRSMARRAPRIITSHSTATALYRPQLRFRSVVTGTPTHNVSLIVGIAQVLEAVRARYVRGQSGQFGT